MPQSEKMNNSLLHLEAGHGSYPNKNKIVEEEEVIDETIHIYPGAQEIQGKLKKSLRIF